MNRAPFAADSIFSEATAINVSNASAVSPERRQGEVGELRPASVDPPKYERYGEPHALGSICTSRATAVAFSSYPPSEETQSSNWENRVTEVTDKDPTHRVFSWVLFPKNLCEACGARANHTVVMSRAPISASRSVAVGRHGERAACLRCGWRSITDLAGVIAVEG
jgi:hypothetical protein